MSDDKRKREKELKNQTSMRYWWPRLEPLDVPTPQTICVEASEQKIELGELPNGEMDYMMCQYPNEIDDIRDAVEAVNGPPAFLRTDHASHKHMMEDGSRIDSLEHVGRNVWNVVEHNEMAGFYGLPYDRFYVREWLELYHEFTAFRGTPIAAELRFFIYEGGVHSCGFYWAKEAIQRSPPDDANWEQKYQQIRETVFAEPIHSRARQYAERVADEFQDEYWSVDFALTDDEEWYCIDIARGELSEHPDECEPPRALQAENERGDDA